MPVSIAQVQSTFLKAGGLNDLGSTGDFVPDASENALIQLAGLLITNAQNNLAASNQISSGALSDSFTVIDPVDAANIIKLDISALDYYDYQNKGVRGTRAGNSSANYSFKNENPSTGMVEAFEAWIERGGQVTSNVPKQHTITGHESKQKTISAYDNAYAVAKRVKQKGIDGSGYFDKAIKVAQTYAADILGKALVIDVTRVIPKTLNNGNNNTK